MSFLNKRMIQLTGKNGGAGRLWRDDLGGELVGVYDENLGREGGGGVYIFYTE